ncbi:MAG TPA: hypothetical protein VF816_01515 [Rhodocyclaceae bacterium]
MKPAFDRAVLVFFAVLAKLMFLLYKLLAWPLVLIAPFTIFWLAYLSANRFAEAALALGALAAASTYSLYRYGGRSLPASPADTLPARIGDRFIAWLGTIKFFTSPLCLVEDPGSYRIKGSDIRALVDGDAPLLQPGDILLRGYDGYLDGELIRRTGGAVGAGRYLSHAALYLGPVDDVRDRQVAARRLKVREADGGWRPATQFEMDQVRDDPSFFQPGRQMVVHAMAKGVHLEDILTFLRCDYLVVLRLPDEIALSEADAGNRPLVALKSDAAAIDGRLAQRERLTRAEVFVSARDSALGRVGTGYDFLFDSCRSFHKFSCSEFVYYCYKSMHRYLGLAPKAHSFAGLFKRITISPADVYAACDPGGKLRLVWSNVPRQG